LNVDLVSPVYANTNNLECHRPPDYNVCTGDTTRSGFIIMPDDLYVGTLIYRLQRRHPRESTEISEDTSSAVYLLVFWVILNFKKLHTDVLLVEHDKRFIWSKDNLEELSRKNINRFRLYTDAGTETWSLNDNTTLMTTSEIMDKDLILDITISEVEKDNNTRIPAYIDQER
jgi:hypothetical protein